LRTGFSIAGILFLVSLTIFSKVNVKILVLN
jgi:hypothetical protein